MPTVFLGFYGNYTFKKWGAGFSMRGEIGRYVYNNVNSGGGVAEANGRSQNVINNLTADYLNTKFTTYQVKSDYYLERADFLRLDNIYLSYNFGKIPKTDLSCRVSASVQNAFVFTNYSGIDPEIFSGIDNNIYPRARIFNLNFNFRF